MTLIPMSGQITAKGGTPTVVVNTAVAGSGASATISGTNMAGKIVLTSGTALLTTGKVLSLNFADGFTFPNGGFAVFSPGDINFALLAARLYVVTRVDGVDLYVVTNPLTLSTQYTGYYQILGN